MANGSAIPVVAGLAVGIGFVALFSAMLKPDVAPSDKELVSKYSELAEVKYFLEKYPDAKAEVSRSQNEDNIEISYSVERQAEQPSGLDKGINNLGIHVYTKSTYLPLEILCRVHEGGTIGWAFDGVGTIDEAEKTCFDGDYPPVSSDVPRSPVQ